MPARLRLPENHAAEALFMSGEEVDRLTAAMPEKYTALVTVLARTGLRWSELAGLTRKRIDFFRKRLTVAETYTDGRFAPVTTPASRRTIELSTGTVEALAEHLRVHRPDIGPDDFIFTTPHGMGLDDNRFRARVWRPAVECAGLSVRRPTPHDRHTHAAWLIEDGRHVKEIQARLGHSSITTTMNGYGHLLPGVGEGRLDSLDSRRRTDAVWQREAPSS